MTNACRGCFRVLVICGLIIAAGDLASINEPADTTKMHFAFDGKSSAVIRPANYPQEGDVGFAESPTLASNGRGVQAEKFMRFDATFPDGNYDVTVTLGSPTVESTTTIRSEAHRPAAVDIHTSKGQYIPVKFTVNIHKDVRPVNRDLNSDGKLHLQFIGNNPSITAVDIRPNTTVPTVYIVGDSTACDYNADPRVGWGQMFPFFFKPGEIAVCNLARSGRSAKSFINEKRLEDIDNTIKPGDYMLIQFAHNDMKDTALTPESWKAVLMNYLEVARKHNAQTVMVTSMPRRQFDENNKIKNSLGEFPQTTRDFAKEQNLPLIDLNVKATAFFDALGPELSKKAFCYYPLGIYEVRTPNPPNNMDNTHFNPYGAYELAKIVAGEIKASKTPLAAHVVDKLEPVNTDPSKFPASLNYNPLLIDKDKHL